MVRGVVARNDGTGWLVSSSPTDLSDSVGLVIDRITLDGTDYIEIVACGHVGNIPVIGGSNGLLYVDSNGKLTSNAPGGAQKPFAVAWQNGDARNGVILNQNHAGSGSGSRNYGAGAGNIINAPGNWAYQSTTMGGATYGSAINGNMLVNGGFDIWQRSIGKDGVYGATGTTYFADS